MLLLQNRDSAKHMGYHFFKSLTLFAYKLEKINILILIHYFQSPNFIDSNSILNKTQNTKQRKGMEIFKRDSPWVLTLEMRSRWSSRFGAPLWLRGDGPQLLGGSARRRRCLWSGGNGGDPAADAIFVAQPQSQREERVASGGGGGRLAWEGVWSGGYGCLNVRGESVRVKSMGHVG